MLCNTNIFNKFTGYIRLTTNKIIHLTSCIYNFIINKKYEFRRKNQIDIT